MLGNSSPMSTNAPSTMRWTRRPGRAKCRRREKSDQPHASSQAAAALPRRRSERIGCERLGERPQIRERRHRAEWIRATATRRSRRRRKTSHQFSHHILDGRNVFTKRLDRVLQRSRMIRRRIHCETTKKEREKQRSENQRPTQAASVKETTSQRPRAN